MEALASGWAIAATLCSRDRLGIPERSRTCPEARDSARTAHAKHHVLMDIRTSLTLTSPVFDTSHIAQYSCFFRILISLLGDCEERGVQYKPQHFSRANVSSAPVFFCLFLFTKKTLPAGRRRKRKHGLEKIQCFRFEGYLQTSIWMVGLGVLISKGGVPNVRKRTA